jgi:hypothetical protein
MSILERFAVGVLVFVIIITCLSLYRMPVYSKSNLPRHEMTCAVASLSTTCSEH